MTPPSHQYKFGGECDITQGTPAKRERLSKTETDRSLLCTVEGQYDINVVFEESLIT